MSFHGRFNLIALCQFLILATADRMETMNCKRHFLWCFSVGKFYDNPSLHQSIQKLFAGMVNPRVFYYAFILSIGTKQSTCQHTYLMATSDPQNELFRSSNRNIQHRNHLYQTLVKACYVQPILDNVAHFSNEYLQ
jgi:hypothetical protein